MGGRAGIDGVLSLRITAQDLSVNACVMFPYALLADPFQTHAGSCRCCL